MANIANRFSRFLLKSNFSSRNVISKSIMTSSNCSKIFKIQDEKDFEEKVLNSELPVVIQFQASWCGPCKMLEPRLENIIGNNSDKVHLAKVDIDDNAEIAMNFNVEAVPHVLGFRDGKTQKSFSGLKDEDQIESFVNELIGS